MDWSNILTILVAVAVWVILTRLVFPRLGVPT